MLPSIKKSVSLVESLVSLLPFVVIILVFWLLLIRPQQKRQRQVQEMQRALQVDDTVMLTSGFYGQVREITDDYVSVQIADGVVVRVVRAAIGQKVDPSSPIAGGSGETNDDPTGTEAPRQETLEETSERVGLDKKAEENE